MRVSQPFPPFVAALVAILLAIPGPSRSDTSASKAASGKEPIKWRSIASGDAEAKKSGKPALHASMKQPQREECSGKGDQQDPRHLVAGPTVRCQHDEVLEIRRNRPHHQGRED